MAAVAVGVAIITAIYIPLQKSAVVHMAYGSLVLAAILAGVALWQLSRTSAKDYITSVAFPLALKGYLAATAAMAVAFVALDLSGVWSIPVLWYAALQVIVIGLTAWKLLAIGAASDAIRETGEQVQENVSNWRLLRADAEAVLRAAPADMRRDITAVRDAIRYADPMSKPEVAAQEQEIAAGIKQLRELVSEHKTFKAKALCGQLQNALRDRANRLKILK